MWGIGFSGHNYDRVPYKLYPGGVQWNTVDRLLGFLELLANREMGFTHCFILQDHFMLIHGDFPDTLKSICDTNGIVLTYYFPVDAPIDAEWTKMMEIADVPVAYTEYGKREVYRARKNKPLPQAIRVIPHGVDTETFYVTPPLPADAGEKAPSIAQIREHARLMWKINGQPWLKPTDFLLVNVNQNQRRKDPARSLEILAGLKSKGVPAKLVMHMRSESDSGVNLEQVGRQLGLKLNEDWMHHGEYFVGGLGTFREDQLRRMYWAADLYLTTTLGEGWGLGITEALACGCPVAAPDHTSCREIYELLGSHGPKMMRLMPVENGRVVMDLDNSRMRPRVEMGEAVRIIAGLNRNRPQQQRLSLPADIVQKFSWSRIAAEFLAEMLEFRKEPRAQRSIGNLQGLALCVQS